MDFKFDFSTFAGLLAIAGFVPYIASILRGTSSPSKASWMVWCALDWVIMFGLIAKDKVTGQMVGYCVGATIVLVLAIKRGTPGWSKLDILSINCAGIGVIAWMAMGDPRAAIVTSLVVMVFGSVPTFVRAW